MAKDRFLSAVQDYFDNVADYKGLSNFAIVFSRADGVPLYMKNFMSQGVDESSVGALVAGLWQAASSLVSFVPSDESGEEFRLSFDTSSKGVYILPINHQIESFQLGIIFYDVINPGLLKSRLRNLANQLNFFLEQVFCEEETKEEKEDLLFEDISDEEMDSMFAQFS